MKKVALITGLVLFAGMGILTAVPQPNSHHCNQCGFKDGKAANGWKCAKWSEDTNHPGLCTCGHDKHDHNM